MQTEIKTYFTVADGKTKLLHSAETWTRYKLILESAGDVAVGTSEELAPVNSGRGVKLAPDGEPLEIDLPRGNRLYIIANTINRVKVIVQPVPWAEEIACMVKRVTETLDRLERK